MYAQGYMDEVSIVELGNFLASESNIVPTAVRSSGVAM